MTKEKVEAVWRPQARQAVFMARAEDEALYGGAAGGGKSDALVVEATRQVGVPHYKGLILRKTFPQLQEIIDKSQKYYPRAFPQARYNASEHCWRFPSGAKIVFGSIQHSGDKIKFQGQAFDFIAFDELTHFSFDEYMFLLSRNRPNGNGTRCYVRATANPGGIGHAWVKERFITAAKPMTTIYEDVPVVFPDGSTQMRRRSRIFVPSSVFDNKILLKNDPDYVARLAAMPEAERKALLYGDWESYSGQFFSAFKNDPAHYEDRRWTHIIAAFEIPSDWTIYRSFDWGYHRPFSVGWWAVAHDGCAYRILEYYGCKSTPNTGVEMIPDEVFAEVHRIESEHRWLKGKKIFGVADPAIWNAQTGESVADVAAKHQVYFSRGDNARIPGWLQCQYRLAFDKNGFAMMYVFENCKDFARTIPTLVYDERKVEDLNTDGEDHIADEWRYFCMSRPIKPRANVGNDRYYESPLYTALGIDKSDLPPQRERQKIEFLGE